MDNQNIPQNPPPFYPNNNFPGVIIGENKKTSVSLYVCDIPQNITKEELDSVF